MNDRNCLSWWFLKLVAAGLPVPKTHILTTALPLEQLVSEDPQPIEGLNDFVMQLQAAAKPFGAPFFLRTGQGSGKHRWKDTCFVPALDLPTIFRHVCALVEWSHEVDLFGLAHDVWCVRELLPVCPVAVLDAYEGMPLVPEVRAFVCEGRVVCTHGYWPAKAICEGFVSEPEDIGKTIGMLQCLVANLAIESSALLTQVAEVFRNDGAFSVDILQMTRGPFVTDMALANRSFHWQGCPHAREFV